MPSPELEPVGPISVALDAMRTLVASLPVFQGLLDTSAVIDTLPNVFAGEVGIPIESYTVASNTVTVTTRRPHNLTTLTFATIEGASISAQSDRNISGLITVGVIPSTTTFSFSKTITDTDEPVFPDFAYVIPCQRPYAVVCESEDNPLRSASVGTGGASVLAGEIDVLIEADVSSSYINDPVFAPVEARNSAATILQQMIQMQGTGNLIVLNSCNLVSVEFINTSEQDSNVKRFERWRALYRVSWGLDG